MSANWLMIDDNEMRILLRFLSCFKHVRTQRDFVVVLLRYLVLFVFVETMKQIIKLNDSELFDFSHAACLRL
jgi:hypothetical protein